MDDPGVGAQIQQSLHPLQQVLQHRRQVMGQADLHVLLLPPGVTWMGSYSELDIAPNVQFWMFAAQLFTVAQGKRLFSAISAGRYP